MTCPRPPRTGVFLVLLASCATAQKNEAPVVHDLTIEGTHHLSPGTIEDLILTTDTGWWPFATKHRFDPLVWDADLKRIERIYEAHGFYRAQVKSAKVIPRKKDQVDLVIQIEEGPPALIENVQVLGLDDLPARERGRVTAKLPLTPGTPFVESNWQQAKADMLARLRAQGHEQAKVEGQALVDVEQARVKPTLLAIPGPAYRYGEIQVASQPGARVEPWRIQEEVHLALDDSLFSDEGLDEAEGRIFGMGVFSTARVTVGTPDRMSLRVPVLVEVREAPMRTLKLGGGVAVDQIRQEARLISEWTHRNFLGGLRKLTLQAVAGWAFLPGVLPVLRGDDESRSGPIYRLKAEFEQPRFLGRPALRYQSLLENDRTLEQTYTALGARARNGVSWKPVSTLTVFPSYQIQGYRLNGTYSTTAQTAQSAPLALGCSTDPCFVLLSYLEQVVTWDKRDNRLEPRRGHYLSLSVQEGGGPLQGDFTYLRIVPEARGFVSFGEKRWLTLAGRLEVGTLLTSSGRPEDSAVVTRFESGGSMSMRGYNLRRLSPLILVPATSGKNPVLVTLPIGGNGTIEGNFEVRMALSSSLVLALFADFGTVTRGPLGPDALPTLQFAVGIGLRYLTAVGPIRLDLGFRLPVGRPPPLYRGTDGKEITYLACVAGKPETCVSPGPGVTDGAPLTNEGRESGVNRNNTCFGVGGNSNPTWVRDGMCVFHISIGEAF
jgi:translocation and assembly module TamA